MKREAIVHREPAGVSTATPTDRREELLRCVAPLPAWVERQIEERCLFPPSEIEAVLFSFVLRSPGEPPDVAATVWLTRPLPSAEIASRFGGERRDLANPITSSGAPVRKPSIEIKGERALVIRDERSFGVGSQTAAQEMADAAERPNPTDESIEELLRQSDESREITILFRPDDLDRFRSSLFPPEFQEFAHQLVRWIDPETVEGVALSVDLGDPLRLRMELRNRTAISVKRLEIDVHDRLERLPDELVRYVRRLRPSTSGHRKLVGRLPAMWKAVSLGTVATQQPRLVAFESELPERAAPNLSLGMRLVLSAPQPSQSAPPRTRPTDGGSASATSVAERLRTTIDVDLRRTPLSEAFSSIGEEIGLTFDIDGNALKSAGYTKNMPQTIHVDRVAAIDALRAILKPYDKLALIVDEAQNKITVTTHEAARTRGQQPLRMEKPITK